jgi:hypothetical protein
MISDVTNSIRELMTGDVQNAIDALAVLEQHFGRETMSTAIGELSERLIEKYLNGTRTSRGKQGHDLILPNGNLVEIKSRFLAHYADTLQFNFGRHTERATTVFCVAWVGGNGEKPRLEQVLHLPVQYLMAKWGTPNQTRYCARTSLGKLKAAAQQSKELK